MAKAIKLVCHQNTANYKKPASIDVQESFKFPPYSTIIGMIHRLCDFTEYKPMQLSIQGSYASSISNLYTRHFYDKSGKSTPSSPRYAELIIDVDLIIHIKPDDENMLEAILQGLSKPVVFPALGRHEDILRIDTVVAVEIEETKETDDIYLDNDAYIPINYFSNAADITGTVYTLNKEFNKNEPGKIRTWKKEGGKVKVKYVKKGAYLNLAKKIYKEKNNKIGVFFA